VRSVGQAAGLGAGIAAAVGLYHVLFRNPATLDLNRTFGPDSETWTAYMLPHLLFGAAGMLTMGAGVGAVAYGFWRLISRLRT
jgi:hypothetical protein